MAHYEVYLCVLCVETCVKRNLKLGILKGKINRCDCYCRLQRKGSFSLHRGVQIPDGNKPKYVSEMSFCASNTINAFKISSFENCLEGMFFFHHTSLWFSESCLVDCEVSVFFFSLSPPTMFFQTIFTYYPLRSLLAAVWLFYRHDSICPWWHIR